MPRPCDLAFYLADEILPSWSGVVAIVTILKHNSETFTKMMYVLIHKYIYILNSGFL